MKTIERLCMFASPISKGEVITLKISKNYYIEQYRIKNNLLILKFICYIILILIQYIKKRLENVYNTYITCLYIFI